ncbi:MAG: hypothetical protein RL394_6 [Bacteroidota bacterium]|jgi:hypothetical protein
MKFSASRHWVICISLALLAYQSTVAQTIYVSIKGNDQYPGTKARPIASFSKAQDLVRKSGEKTAKVIFLAGTYYLPETVRFTDKDGKSSVVYMAEKEGSVVISGGKQLQLRWTKSSQGWYTASIPADTTIDQLYINGVRQRMARFPNAVEGKNVFDTWDLSHGMKSDSARDPLNPKRIANWKNPAGGYVNAMHTALWGDMHWLIKGKKENGELIEEGGWQNNRPSPKHPGYRMVENIFEELDAPGEWFYNEKEEKLYYIPAPGLDISKAKVEIVRLKHLIEFNGSKASPVSNIELKGFVFKHAARTFMENKEPLLRSDWTVYRGGAVVFNGAVGCKLMDCEFDQVGGNAIFINNYNRNLTVAGCYIHHVGANGIAFVGDPDAVRSPLFRYAKQEFNSIDRTPGPKSDNYPSNCRVEDCLITMTGRDEKQTSPVHISMSHKISVSHCSIYDVPRAGININEGTFGGHVIQHNDVFNTVLETGDHGSFNSWGRDRYWTPDINESVPEVRKDQQFPFLDMLAPNIIRNNRMRCDHGWDIDLDDGSSWYRIYNNLLLNGGLKMREGFDRIATNNIIINNGLHPHVWYPNSGDVFAHNIVFRAYSPALMNKGIPADGKWGKKLDSNFYVATFGAMKKFIANGCDSNSIAGDAGFINPYLGNYGLTTTSKAYSVGFVPFAMDDFGVQKASLKAISKTPAFPKVSNLADADKIINGRKYAVWQSTKLWRPRGEEFSAFGIDFSSTGIALDGVVENSALHLMGFRNGDLIQSVNSVTIKTIADFKGYLSNNKNTGEHHFDIIRNQKLIKLVIKKTLPNVLD